nr:hypothetical protein BaRGS_020385 [Batillaria attramentaria]
MVMLKNIWASKVVSIRIKLCIFNSNVKSVLLYGCETWKTTKTMQQKIQTFLNTCLRRIFNIRWPEKIRNEELWERAGQEPSAKQILRRKWGWIGHTLRKPASSTTRQALTWNPQGKRKRGRHRNSWRRDTEAELYKQGTNWTGVSRIAQNRVRWRRVVDGLCSTWSQGPKTCSHFVLLEAEIISSEDREIGWLSVTMLLGILLSACLAYAGAQGTNTNQTAAQEFLDFYNTDAQRVLSASAEVSWAYNTNITAENQERMVESSLQTGIWRQNMSRMASEFDTSSFPADMQRQFAKIKDIGTAALEDLSKLEQLMSEDMAFQAVLGENFELGYQDTGDYWRSWYETATFEQDVAALFKELKPFYEQLHAFVRRRLKAQYGASLFPSTGHIPAHLLGNMWAQTWSSLQDLLMPYPSKPILDVTDEMVKQGYTAEKIFETADDFFVSLGMIAMPQEFWDKSMLTKPTDGREVVCHASAWDFYNGIDFRSVQDSAQRKITCSLVRCTQATSGFHEAVGDVISLSVETPKHLNKIGLLPELVEDNEATLNFLMAMALQKIAFLPFGYLIDQWRWYFVSFVLQFQFHKALCEAAGHTGPLHTCDIYNSTEAGQKLSDMLKVGSSQVWTEPFEALVGSRNMSAQPLVDYFQPLMNFLKEANGDDVGWQDECPGVTTQSTSSRLLPSFGFLGLLLWLLCVLAV